MSRKNDGAFSLTWPCKPMSMFLISCSMQRLCTSTRAGLKRVGRHPVGRRFLQLDKVDLWEKFFQYFCHVVGRFVAHPNYESPRGTAQAGGNYSVDKAIFSDTDGGVFVFSFQVLLIIVIGTKGFSEALCVV